MPGAVPAWLTMIFVALVLVMALLVVAAVWAQRGPGPGRALAIALGAWLALSALAARAGVFADFSHLPPRIPLLLIPLLGLIVALCRSVGVGRLLDEIPSGWLIYPQAFRIVMELILWQLFVAGAAPAIMTFEGRNADILVGLTAPLVAWLLARRTLSAAAARWWNIAGILILVSVVVHAQLSAPTPYRVYVTEPPMTFVAYAPWIWLVTFLVPLAWTLHALSIRQLRRRAR
ncbi:MAG TPA: hypothetical protein VJU81_07465 [Methylomirabilota bacterium]|nr:hypothetical protein [Methylomirabilota bacterium]